MVENKHSINTILSFGAKSVNPEVLESLLTGRDKTADFLEKKVKTIVENGDNQFILVIGQRGMGKTHLLRVLHSRILPYTVENKLVIAYFAEEEYGVANFFDFLLRVLNSFIKWNDKDADFLRNELENLQNTSVNNQLNYLEKIIRDYIKAKPLLIITENFGDILDHMGQEQQGRLRAWLYENNNVSIVASSQSISDNFDREDRPFYGFFTPYYLKTLSFEESYSFLISLAEIEKNDKLVEHLKTNGKPQIRAIYDLVKGNHRLLVTFFNFLKTDMLAKVSENFIKTINDLKPYYETYIRYLPAQQQKILRYIALSRKPQLGIEISKNCFIEQKSLSKQLSELNKKRLIDIISDPSDKRNKFYDISEPLLRISIEVGEHKEGITAIFIDFLAMYYNAEELIDRASRISKIFNDRGSNLSVHQYKYEIAAIKLAMQKKSELLKIELPKKVNKLLDQDKLEEIVEFIDHHNNTEKLLKIDRNLIIIPFAILLFDHNQIIRSFDLFKEIHEDISDVVNNKKYQSVFQIPKEEFLYKYASSYIEYGNEKNNFDIINKGFTELKQIEDINGSYFLYSIFTEIRLLKMKRLKDKNLLENECQNIYNKLKIADENFILNEEDVILYYSVLLTLGAFVSEELIDEKLLNQIEDFFLLKIEKENKIEKIRIIKSFISIGDYWFFKEFKNFIQKNIVEFKNDVVNAVNNILIEDELKEFHIAELNKFIIDNKSKVPELSISEIYLNTYNQVVLNNNESALYKLPKEQREFFQQKILKRKP